MERKESEYQTELKKLNDQIKKLTDLREHDLSDFDLEKSLFGVQYDLPEELPSSIKIDTAKRAVKSELAKSGLIMKRNEAGSIVIVDKDGYPAFNERHDIIEVNSFIDEALVKNKLLKINDGSQHSSTGAGVFKSNSNGGRQKNSGILSDIDEQINELTASSVQ